MNFFKTVWGLLFRLFPCPARIGIHKIGNPGPDSPVLITCNFDLTLKRLNKVLRGLDVWLLAGDSKGVNVWCAAGGDEFNTHSVIAILKTSGIAKKVNHRVVILPPLGGPGIKASEVKEKTGWHLKWGPVYAKDLPRYIAGNFKRHESMKRVKYALGERLDTALGSLFPIFFLGAGGFFLFTPHLLIDYLITGSTAFVFFMALVPWIPGRNGLKKALFCDAVFAVLLAIPALFFPSITNPLHTHLVISMVMVPVYGLELGGLASTMPSDLDPFLAKLGIGSIGNVEFAGTVRTELLRGIKRLRIEPQTCIGCRTCTEICPQGVWSIGKDKKATMIHRTECTACRACLVQCPTGAIRAAAVSLQGEG